MGCVALLKLQNRQAKKKRLKNTQTCSEMWYFILWWKGYNTSVDQLCLFWRWQDRLRLSDSEMICWNWLAFSVCTRFLAMVSGVSEDTQTVSKTCIILRTDGSSVTNVGRPWIESGTLISASRCITYVATAGKTRTWNRIVRPTMRIPRPSSISCSSKAFLQEISTLIKSWVAR